MLSYPYIESLFQSVLNQSKAIKGHFHICPQFGHELNTDNLEEVLKFSFGDQYKEKQYPLALMMPPQSSGDYMEDYFKDEYEVTMMFLNASFQLPGNQIASLNPNTNTSQHRLLFDWHDMKRCAVMFIKTLQKVFNSTFHIKQNSNPLIEPVTMIGNDGVSGVILYFTLVLNESCTEDDYPSDFETTFQLPESVDSHPEHL
ncbi:hypothetical protein F0919_17935 [Taibaiella lutea]|uniref:Uncharacterized protein n=1 Tax=Taibaiella lutea TaxID=2608001 RepID=A0A5M6CFG7_9BACT|nr:hypothetical protein [Taibaiella lutea]KAA5532662.1 hypothetical protein F0919_17935 [Taibaiella lutea]